MATTLKSLIRRALRRRPGRHFARDQRGATMVEFGLLALPFFSIVGAILETSVVALSGQVLESAVQDAGRLIRTGQAQQGDFDIEDFRGEVCGRLFGLFRDCGGLHIEVDVVTDFNSITPSAPVDWECQVDCEWTREELFTPGVGSSTVVVQVYYRWPLILSFANFSLATLGDGQRVLGAVTVFRNEPFTL